MQEGETVKPGSNGSSEPTQPTPNEAKPQGQFNPEDGARTGATDNRTAAQEISWTASEYIAHPKNASWYAGLGLGAAILAALIYLITDDVVSAVVVVIVAVIFGVAAARQPRTLPYKIAHDGIMIGEKFYPYADLKSFSVIEEGAINSIMLLPMKRFIPPLTIYYPPEQEDQVINVLGSYLPHETREIDPVDRLMRKVRF